MKTFKSKQEVFEYVKSRYFEAETILIKGSTIKEKIKNFSDIDVKFYQDSFSSNISQVSLCFNLQKNA
ncbi:hypothetical protein HYW76_03765, partial [Candidatus Pacearchaeota archaeon]|nr:hypothetical protein [Candidatus Pacearchaeota archaeon]